MLRNNRGHIPAVARRSLAVRGLLVGATATALIATGVPAALAGPSGSVTLLVAAKHGVSAQQRQAIVARHGGSQGRSVDALGLSVVTVPSGQQASYLRRYAADSQVAHVEVQRARSVASVATDPGYGEQWALPQIGWQDVHGATSPAGTAVIAVLDTGVDADAEVQLVPGWSAFGTDPAQDSNGHGTALATIAAAATDNDRGIAGVAFAGVRVMPVQVLGSDGSGQDSDIIAGVVAAADAGADVILMGFSNPGFSQALQDAVDYAWARGAVLVAATGNDASTSPTYPAGSAKVVGVSATDATDALAVFSNSGEDTFLGAPGVGIATGTGTVSGTSASAAIVAGAAALLVANDGAANGVVVGRLARNADLAGTASDTGNGRVNLARAIADTSTDAVVPAGVAGAGGPLVGPYAAAALSVTATFDLATSTITATKADPGNTGKTYRFAYFAPGVSTTSGTPDHVSATCYGASSNVDTYALPAGYATGSWTVVVRRYNDTACGGDIKATAESVVAVANAPTTTVLTRTSGSSPSTYGTAVAFTATVTAAGGNPSGVGTVDVLDGATVLCNDVALTGNAATCPVSSLGVGTHSLTAVYSGAPGYLGSTSGALSQVVNPATLTVTATDALRSYGAANPAFASTITGYVLGESAVVVTGAAVCSTLADGSSPVGTYDITCDVSGLSAANYLFTPVSGTLTVAAKALTITALDQGKTYGDALTLCASPSDYSVVGLEPGDSVASVTCTSTGAAAAATYVAGPTYPIVPSAATGTGLGNYTIGYVSGTLTLVQRALTITANSTSKTYGDAVSFAGTEFTTGGGQLVNGDAVTSVTLASAGAAATAGVAGSLYSITPSAPVGSGLGNYAISFGNGTLQVTKKALSVTADDASRPYGDGNGTLTATIAGFANAETLATSGVSGTPTCTSLAGTTDPIGGYAITCDVSGLSAANYSFTAVAGTLTVSRRTLTITANNLPKDYGDAVVFDGTEFSSVGLVNSDTLTKVALTSEGAAADAGVVGSPYDIVPSWPLTGTGLGNYAPSFVKGSLTVGKRLLTVACDDQQRDYGSGNPTFTWAYSGFTNGEDETDAGLAGAPTCSTTAASSSPVGDYAIAAGSGTLTSANYDFSLLDGTLTVDPLAIAVVAAPKAKVYGDVDPELTYTHLPALIGSDAFAGGLSRDPGEDVGDYAITQGTLALSSNYVLDFTEALLSITARPIEVTAGDKAKVYGEADPALTFAITSGALQLGDTSAEVFSGALTRAVGEGVGHYAITRGTLVANANYALSFVAGDLEITRATLTVDAVAKAKEFGDADPAGSASLVGFVNDEDGPSAGVTGAAVCTPGPHGTDVGTYPGVYTCTTGDLVAPNYMFVVGSAAALTITPKTTTVTLTVLPATQQYSDKVTLSAQVGPFAGGQMPTGNVTFAIACEAAIAPVAIDGTGLATVTVALAGQVTSTAPCVSAKAVTASFASTNANFADSVASPGTVTETFETATIDYTGYGFFVGATASDSSTTVRMSAVVKEQVDPDGLGDQLGTTTLRFEIFKSSNVTTSPDWSCDSAVVVTAAGIGAASCDRTLPLPDTYRVHVTLLGNGYYQAAPEDVTVTTSAPGTGFTNGGGWLTEPALGTRSNLGFTAKYVKRGAQGSSLYIYRKLLSTNEVANPTGGFLPAGEYNWIIKSNAMTQVAMSCTSTTPKVCTASFTGKSNVTAVHRGSGVAYSLGGNRAFQVDVTDKGEPGASATTSPDSYAIKVTDSAGTYYQLGSTTSQVALKGGNIQVRP